jgi:hypothetical protein
MRLQVKLAQRGFSVGHAMGMPTSIHGTVGAARPHEPTTVCDIALATRRRLRESQLAVTAGKLLECQHRFSSRIHLHEIHRPESRCRVEHADHSCVACAGGACHLGLASAWLRSRDGGGVLGGWLLVSHRSADRSDYSRWRCLLIAGRGAGAAGNRGPGRPTGGAEPSKI